MKASFENCREITSPSDFEIIAQTHARLLCSFLTQIFLQSVVLKKNCMKLGSEKMVSPTCFKIAARPYTRVSYSFSGSIVIHVEKVGLERMSMNLEILIEMVSPTYFETVVRTYVRILYSCPRLMVGHFEDVRLSMNLEKFVDMRRPTCFEFVARCL